MCAGTAAFIIIPIKPPDVFFPSPVTDSSSEVLMNIGGEFAGHQVTVHTLAA